MRITNFRKLLFFMTTVMWYSAFGRTILPAYYLSQGITPYQMVVATLLMFGVQCSFLLLVRKAGAKMMWKLSLVTSFASLLLVIQIHSLWQYYLASIFSGISLATYWVAYNIAYFGATPKQKTGLGSAVMFSVFPVLNIIAPPVAGYLIQQNPAVFWLLSILFFGIAFFFIKPQEDFSINYSIQSSLSEIRATRVFLFLEGIWEALPFAIIPIYTLYFIKTPLSYGTFAAYLAFMGVAANLLLGKATDKLQKRVLFLYPLTFMLVAVTFFFPLATSYLPLWLVATGVLNFFVPLFWNISTSMIIDTHDNLDKAIPGREIVLAGGRVTGLILTLLSFSVESQPKTIYYVLATVLLFYPFYLWWISHLKKKYAFR